MTYKVRARRRRTGIQGSPRQRGSLRWPLRGKPPFTCPVSLQPTGHPGIERLTPEGGKNQEEEARPVAEACQPRLCTLLCRLGQSLKVPELPFSWKSKDTGPHVWPRQGPQQRPVLIGFCFSQKNFLALQEDTCLELFPQEREWALPRSLINSS